MRGAGRGQGGVVAYGLYPAETEIERASGVDQGWGQGLSLFGTRLEVERGSD